MKNLWIFGIVIIGTCLIIIEAQPASIPTENGIAAEEKNKSVKFCDVTLDFSNMSLSAINRNFISSPYIKNLTLQYNRIQHFDSNTFDSLPHLEYLDLSNNELSTRELFSFGKLSSLKSLILDNNFNFPKEDNYRYCSGDLYWNRVRQQCSSKFSELIVMYDYPEMNYLSLRNVYVHSLSTHFKTHFPKLDHLDLSQNRFAASSENLFESIPSTVTKLTINSVGLTALKSHEQLANVTFLNLNFNHFETLSSHYCYENTLCLRGLNNLKILYISRCSIKKIETDAFKDVEKLLDLDISNNEFEEIPDGTFDFIPSLSSLHLSENSLGTMPDISSLQNLTTLVMNAMKNKSIFQSVEEFSQMPKLQILSLRDNGITTLPSSFLNNLPQLRELDLSNNEITFLPSWPMQASLRKLYLNNNQISDIEDISLRDATSLELLELKHNLVSIIKLSSLKKLTEDLILKL